MTFKGFGRASVIAVASALLVAGCSHGAAQGPSFVPQSQPFAAGGFAHPDAGTAIKSIAFGKLPAAAAGKAVCETGGHYGNRYRCRRQTDLRRVRQAGSS